ncbi:hypothetical protein LCP963914a_6647 [Penicillium roqueforti]|nr:hypothetical protein LCP963914a_6647 [Penicillium roqueforti]
MGVIAESGSFKGERFRLPRVGDRAERPRRRRETTTCSATITSFAVNANRGTRPTFTLLSLPSSCYPGKHNLYKLSAIYQPSSTFPRPIYMTREHSLGILKGPNTILHCECPPGLRILLSLRNRRSSGGQSASGPEPAYANANANANAPSTGLPAIAHDRLVGHLSKAVEAAQNDLTTAWREHQNFKDKNI